MLHLIFHDPYAPSQIAIETIFDWADPIPHLISYPLIQRYSPYSRKTITVKRCNLLIIDISPYTKLDFYLIAVAANQARLSGTLHQFDPISYPELFI